MVTIQIGDRVATYVDSHWRSADPVLESMLNAVTPGPDEYSPADGDPLLFVARRILEKFPTGTLLARPQTPARDPDAASVVF